jgi:N-methylhydantoinase A
VDAAIIPVEALKIGGKVAGPAIIESNFTSVVIDPGAIAERLSDGGLLVTIERHLATGGKA